MTATYIALATYTVAVADAEVVFSSIPATYRDLVLVSSALTSGGENNVAVIRLNSDSGTNYSRVQMIGDGGSTPSFAGGGENAFYGSYFGTATQPSANVYQFMDYAQTNKHKTVLMRTNINTRTMASANRWGNTNAINTISLAPNSGLFAIGSTFSLYGIN